MLAFMLDTLWQLVGGVPLTLSLTAFAVVNGFIIALVLVLMRSSRLLIWPARLYVFLFRSVPLLMLIFLVYYGLSQFPSLRASFLWPYLREPYWCAIIALSLNTSAYSSELIRGGFQAIPQGQIEAAMATGMSRFTLLRRILLPIAIRQALPAYCSEIILLLKATSLVSIITLMEITGIAHRIIASTYRPFEVFICAGAIYLTMNFVITRLFLSLEYRLSPHLRPAPDAPAPLREASA
jgi:octopine/nopaline transport system permease protein